jgi:hypothetical protein
MPVRGPKDLLALTESDKAALEAVEAAIDASPELSGFDGNDITVKLSEKVWKDHMSIRSDVRIQELHSRLRKAGWVQTEIYRPGHGPNRQEFWVKLSQHQARSYGSGRD